MESTSHKPQSTAAEAVDTIQARLVDYASALSFDLLPPEVIQAAKLRIIDTLGATIGGYSGEPCRITRTLAATMPSETGATVLGTRLRTSPEMAAFCNATAARHLEYTDFYHWPGAVDGHASDVLAAILASAEHVRASGRDFVAAVVLGYEVFLRFCDTFPKAGFDYTNCSLLGSAIASGRLMRLDPAALGHCIALAVVPNVILKQVRRDGKTDFKPTATGHAGRAAVFAALLARAGMTGPNRPFEGSHGFCDFVLGKRFALGPMGGDGGSFKILDSQIKIRPAERNTVPLILAAEKLSPLPPLDTIARIVVETYGKAIAEVGTKPAIWDPRSHYDAYHSIPYAVAAALLDGAITLHSFDEAHLGNATLRELMQKITLQENPGFSRAFHAEPVEHRARITLHLAAGGVLTAEVGGDDDRRIQSDEKEIAGKFRSLTEAVLGSSRVDRILDRLLHVEAIEDMSTLPGDFAI